MSQGNYAEEFKEHILSHEAGVSVRELARRYEPCDSKLETSSQGEGELEPVRVKCRSCVAYSVAIRS